MSRTLAQLRSEILLLFALTGPDEWLTPTNVCDELQVGHNRAYDRVALVLERLAHEGLLELRNPRSRGKRYFRWMRA
jgi:hypothetical protein